MSMFRSKYVPKEQNKDQWTMDTLREYVLAVMATNDARYSERFESSQTALQAALTAQQTAMQTAFTSQKQLVDAALAAADRAVNKAEVASEKRFESVNEFRATLADQQSRLMPRTEAELLIATVTDKINEINKAIATLREMRIEAGGRSSGSAAVWGYVVGAAGVVLALIFHFVK